MSSNDVTERFALTGKTIVVTGGVGILGTLYCHRLAEAGARVVVADREAEACLALAAKLDTSSGQAHLGLAVDLANEASVVAWGRAVLEACGAVDVLINNAATKSEHFFAPLEDFPLADWNEVMGVNVTGMFLAVRALGPAMAERGRGSIVNVASIYGVVGPDQRIYEGSWYEALGGPINTPLVYAASKGAVIALTRYLATYWGHRGVRTNTLTPGGVASGQNAEFAEKYGARVPLGRMAEAEEIAGALLFLCSDASSYVNGQNLIVDGGWTAW